MVHLPLHEYQAAVVYICANIHQGMLFLEKSLYDLCAGLSEKMPIANSEAAHEIGTAQEMSLAMHMRMRGRTFKAAEMTLHVKDAEKRASHSIGRSLMQICLDGDDGTIGTVLLERLRKYCKENDNDLNMKYILADVEVNSLGLL